jgi:hypothetical protein
LRVSAPGDCASTRAGRYRPTEEAAIIGEAAGEAIVEVGRRLLAPTVTGYLDRGRGRAGSRAVAVD